MRVFAACLLFLLAVVTAEDKKTYRGHKLLSVRPATEEHLKLLSGFLDTNPEIVFLTLPSTSRPTEFVVPPEQYDVIMRALHEVGLQETLLSPDLEKELNAEWENNEKNRAMNPLPRQVSPEGRYSPAHNQYYTYAEINTILQNFANAFPTLARVQALSRLSEEGRTVNSIQLGLNSNKPVIIVEASAHAREWIAAASVIYTIDQLLNGYSQGNADARFALDNFNWIFIPLVNPDGYIYSWSTDRLWRKNRKFVSTSCYGVDLNRNFDVQFGGAGVSTNCRSEIYLGPYAFSESETQNLQLLVQSVRSRLVGYLSVHSYGQMLLRPWGYTVNSADVPPNVAELNRVGQALTQTLNSYGTTYSYGTAFQILGYAASGGSEDWALAYVPGIYAYCYELRPATSGQGGFVVGTEYIIPTGRELHASLITMSKVIP